MYLIRFMSYPEFAKLRNGETLVNNTDHGAIGRHTNSKGFCFFDLDGLDYLPEKIDEILEYASGIVSEDVAVIFDSRYADLHKGYGIYANPYSWDFFSTICVDEYSIEEYNKTVLQPLYYSENIRNVYWGDEYAKILEWTD